MADMEEDFVTPDVLNSDDNSDEESVGDDDRSHNKLLNAISALDGKKKLKQAQRSEPATEISEFTLSTGSDKVKLHQLVGALRNTASHGEIRKQLNRVEKRRTLDVPLAKHEQERVERTVAYDATTKELTKWDPVVRNIRDKETLSFPLEQPGFKLITTDEAVKRFQPRTPMELEIAQLLHGSKNVFKKDQWLTPAEERALRAMDLEEAKERRAELQKYRALLSYQEAKARRQGKIKSKKYHKVLRKERQKGEKKALDELEKKDPEAYVEKLKKIEKDRLKERMSLKHRGGSKKMQKQMIYGKYDDNVRQAVQDMIQKGKELKEKNVNMDSDSDDDNDNDNHGNEGELIDVALATTASGEKNPWMLPPSVKKVSQFSRPKEIVNKDNITKDKTSDTEEGVEKNSTLNNKEKSGKLDIDELFEEMQRKREALHIEKDDEEIIAIKLRKKKKAEKLKAKRKAKKEAAKLKEKQKLGDVVALKSDSEGDVDNNDSSNKKPDKAKKNKKRKRKVAKKRQEDDGDDDEIIHSSLTRKRTLEDMDGNWSEDEDTVKGKKRQGNVNADAGDQDVTERSSGPQTDARIDPKDVVAVETSIRSSVTPNIVSDDDNDSDGGEMDEETRQRMTIAQAFADDDVIEEFRQEKSDKETRDKPKDINLHIPGWGEWAGEGIQPSKRKLKRFRIKAPPAPPRRDRNLDNVIISETKDKSIAKHQVSKIPFPFGSVHDFESSIRAPIGRTWNPETAFKKLTRPKKLTRLGTIIDPIDKSEMFRKQQSLLDKRKQAQKDRAEIRKNGGIKNRKNR